MESALAKGQFEVYLQPKYSLEDGTLAGAEALGGEDGKSGGKPLRKADDQKHQAAGAAHCGQCVYAQHAAHNKGVGHVVDLLEQVADEQRQGEQQNQLCRGTGGHGSGHNNLSIRGTL